MGDKSWLANIVTKRATVMTPLLIMNALVLVFSFGVYLRENVLWVFVPWIFLLAYTIYRHERWSHDSPHLLASEKVALRGMELYGTSENSIQPQQVIDLESISNPEAEDNQPAQKRVAK